MSLSCAAAVTAAGFPAPPLRRRPAPPSSLAAAASPECRRPIGRTMCSAYPAHPFLPEVMEAVDGLYSEFRAIDGLVACNSARVLKAFQNARVGSHAVQLGSRERLIAFCEAVQRSGPIGSFIKPIAGFTPGYASEVIFAHGTFVDGSTSELSCDGPLRDPFTVFCQGGTHWTQWAFVLEEVLRSI